LRSNTATTAIGKPATIAEFIKFASEDLKVDYLFWCTEEPYYSNNLVPFFIREGQMDFAAWHC